MASAEVVLINPPLSTAVSGPPASLAALRAHLAAKDVAVRTLDLNVEILHYVLDNWAQARPELEGQLRQLAEGAPADPLAVAVRRLLHIDLRIIDDLRSDPERKPVVAGLLRAIVGICWLGDLLPGGIQLRTSYQQLQGAMDRLKGSPLVGAFLRSIPFGAPTLVGFSLLAESQLPFAVLMARWLKAVQPGVTIVAGGPYLSELLAPPMSVAPAGIFEDFDYLVVQEGESALEELARCSASGGSPRHPNIVTANGPLPRSPHIEDIEALPPPDFSDLPLDRYFSTDLSLPIYSSKGCSWGHCIFCSQTSLSYRERSVGTFVDGLEQMIRNSGITHFQFVDENIAPERLCAISREILTRKLSVRWFIQVRCEPGLNRDALELMKAAGCHAVELGLESGSQAILRSIRKGIRLVDVDRILGDAAAVGLEVILNCMIGFPEETLDQAVQTVAFVETLASRYPGLRLSCNTQFVKIYEKSRYATSGRVACRPQPLSTVADWPEPAWIDDFKRRYRKHFILTGLPARAGPAKEEAVAQHRPPLVAAPGHCRLIEGVGYDFSKGLASDEPCSYLVILHPAAGTPLVFQLNEVMQSLARCLAGGPLPLRLLREAFTRQFAEYPPGDVEAVFRDGMLRLNEIGALRVW